MADKSTKLAAYLGQLPEAEYKIPPPVAGAANYLVDSYFSKIDERAELERRRRGPPIYEPADPYTHIRELWFGCDLHKVVTINQTYAAYARDRNVYAFCCLFDGEMSNYSIIPFLDSYEFKYMLQGSSGMRVQSTEVSLSLQTKVVLPIYGNYFVQNRGTGKRLYVHFDFCYESPGCVVSVMAGPEDAEEASSFFHALQASMVANDIYYKKCLMFEGGRLDFSAVTRNHWSQIVLKPQLIDSIRQNTTMVLQQMEKLSNLGMCPNRNVLLISPPGMAKTTIFRALSTECEEKITCIWCTGKSINRADDVTQLFQAARDLAPCIIFIEDMDLFGGDRSNTGYGRDLPVLNEFLACLDGQQENRGVVVMASTNDFASMDEALVNRPGRFDNKIEIPYPDYEDRHKMLSSFLTGYKAQPDVSVTKATWKNALKMTEGLTGAYMKDLAKACVLRAVSDGQVEEDGSYCVFTSDNLMSAVDHVMRNWLLGKRAKKHHTIELEARVGEDG